MNDLTIQPSLFGLHHTNKDFTKQDTWGKNQFPNCFPAALACYMGYKGLHPIYLKLSSELKIEHTLVAVENLFGLPPLSPTLHFSFETEYSPYQPLALNNIPRIDLVTFDIATIPRQCLRALEIKLTALPDSTTYNLKEDKYGCEIVIRPDSIIYLALSIASVFANQQEKLRQILSPFCSNIMDWQDPGEIKNLINKMIDALNRICLDRLDQQSFFLMQPIWKTEGKTSILSGHCLDIFVWSDLALTRLFIDTATQHKGFTISRQERTVVWITKMLYDFAMNGHFDGQTVVDTLTYNTKNDKAFAISGAITHQYMTCDVLTVPRIRRDEIRHIILGNGQNFLSPERRLDAAIIATPGLFESLPVENIDL